jgi:uncharacterized protein with HEPN domain
MAAAGNIYRHSYHEILDEVIWRTVRESLPVLRAVIVGEIDRRGSPD